MHACIHIHHMLFSSPTVPSARCGKEQDTRDRYHHFQLPLPEPCLPLQCLATKESDHINQCVHIFKFLHSYCTSLQGLICLMIMRKTKIVYRCPFVSSHVNNNKNNKAFIPIFSVSFVQI